MWYQDKNNVKLLLMIFLVFTFMIVEFVFGILSSSLSLISDGFHMSGDLVSLIIGILARVYSKKKRDHIMSYGYKRAEILGGLFNSFFLISVVFFMIIEAIQRIIDPKNIENPVNVLIVGSIGLFINIIGLAMFHEHGHGHGHGHSHGHSHSHGDNHSHEHSNSHEHNHSRDHDHSHEEKHSSQSHSSQSHSSQSYCSSPYSEKDEIEIVHVGTVDNEIVLETLIEIKDANIENNTHKHNTNLQGVFLHIMSDALGSIAVIISALCSWLVNWEYIKYIDPIVTIFICMLIFNATFPLLKYSIRIVLQAVTENVDYNKLRSELLNIEGVLSIHELHIWLLSDTTSIATLHIKCDKMEDFMKIAQNIQNCMHKNNIHSVTVQPEFDDTILLDEKCLITCESDCNANTCCLNELDQT